MSPIFEAKGFSSKQKMSGLVLAAAGIVFGDIGTSPLYALKTVFDLAGGTPAPDAALGLLSLIIWTLLVTVSLKYVTFVMRADNAGEGGILALMSLLRMGRHHRPFVVALGLFGAALIYGDGAITPAISVLSAVEGLKIIAPDVGHYVLPITIVILLSLFSSQYHGTARIGWVFGPIMVIWFLVIGGLGIWGIVKYPGVICSLNPWCALHFLFTSGKTGFFVLGGVFLAVTGAEALYADMGHIGARAIRLAWYGLVLPSLLLNYAGQTGYYLAGGSIEDNIFYRLCPESWLFLLVGLATIATIIASQAIITGAFSMTRQAIQLGWCPRLRITQTSSDGYGQIYISAINNLLMFTTAGIALLFGSSDRLAAAYGVAVSMTMLMTTMLLYVTMREVWKWNRALSLMTAGAFIVIDAVFLAANLTKFQEGGWVPLALAVCIYILFKIWRRGSVALAKSLHQLTMPVHEFMATLRETSVARVPGTAVFLSKTSEQTPSLIIWHVTHNRALHQHIVTLTVVITQTPTVPEEERITIEKLAPDFWRVVAHYGFMEIADIPALLKLAQKKQCFGLDLDDVVYYIGHETIMHLPDGTGMPQWQEKLFALMQRNSAQIHEYLHLPRDAVVEIGRQIEI
jgi:KUP system potassium uptake protein